MVMLMMIVSAEIMLTVTAKVTIQLMSFTAGVMTYDVEVTIMMVTVTAEVMRLMTVTAEVMI